MLKIAFVLTLFVLSARSQIHGANDHCLRDCSRYSGHKVCGSDHKTYDSMCELSIAACYDHEYHNGHLHVVRQGECPTSFTARPPVDHCNDLCNEDVEHVCGSDGVVYDNKCKFMRAQCEAAKMNQTLFYVTRGDTCPQRRKPDCAQFNLDLSDVAFEDPAAYTPRCPTHREYICASDGRTFTSECQLCSYMETQKVTLEILSTTPCMH